MSWFERNLKGRNPDELDKELGRYLRASGVDRALMQMCGSYGCRRFVIRYEVQGNSVVLTDMETHPLPFGGGPPDPRGAEEGFQPLAAAINRLHQNMSTSLAWSRGAVGVLRDAQDRVEILPLFDEDADEAGLGDLEVPGPPGHPLEGHPYRDMIDANEAGMGAVHGETSRRRGSWTGWSISDDDATLTLEHRTGTTRHRVRVLGTFHPGSNRYVWATGGALFDEPVFESTSFSATMDAVVELGMATCSRLGATWVFMESIGAEGDMVVVAAWD
jgi:hypothetical protein